MPKNVVSYDIEIRAPVDVLGRAAGEARVNFRFVHANVLKVAIEPTDFLFIDTIHTFDQLNAELRLHAGNVHHYIAIHDTSVFGDRGGGESGDADASTKIGIRPAISTFLRTHAAWKLFLYFTNNNGLTVLD